MLRTPSILGPLNSGFVPLSPAAPHAPADSDGNYVIVERQNEVADAYAEATEVVARAARGHVADAVPLAAVVPWQPRSTLHVRIVEGAVISAMCGYFGWGLVRALAGV